MSKYDWEKRSLVETAQELTAEGLLMATGGNLSMRAKDHTAFAITPSDRNYLEMKPEDICIMDAEAGQIEGALKPSVESKMHAAIYNERQDVNAIIHTHQALASALTLIKAPIPALFDEQVRFLGRRVEIIPYAPSGTGMLVKQVAKHVRNHNNAYLLQNHGALIFGDSMERAIENAQVLEKCAKAYLLSLLTDRKISRLPVPIREIIFRMLREDQKRADTGGSDRLNTD
ncbi:MAG: class II aldolase/adducin family protein [Anaerolineaceae bacterium]|nr:class II aldolase/adducin family protein [Anaerolineaceae bacterium]